MPVARLPERPKPGEDRCNSPAAFDNSNPPEGLQQLDVGVSPLLRLPPEILDHILSHLPAQALLCLERTCRKLSHHASTDTFWAAFIRRHVPPADFPLTPSPAPTYRSLYLAHYPYWFLPQHALWFSDDPYNGDIMVARFDPRRGCIEGYRLLGEKGPQSVQQWPYMNNVSIHSFRPRMKLFLDQPRLKLPYTTSPSTRNKGTFPWDDEIRMSIGIPGTNGTATSASFFLTQDIEPRWQDPKMQLWPPRTIPDVPRVRCSQGDSGKFRGPAHKPQAFAKVSETTFRMRLWSQFYVDTTRFGEWLGEVVSTWSTLPRDLYTPTPQKPYQGIWVGDYAGHGCEVLLLIHTPTAPPLPTRRESFNDLFGPILGRDVDDDSDDNFDEAMNGIADPSPNPYSNPNNVLYGGPPHHHPPPKAFNDAHAHEEGHQGALQAIKLTGDINIPRGQHTFIADDLGARGYIRHATEPPFEGARIVHSRGHVALRGFTDDAFVPSQLIMISPDLLAQYWVYMGHISYYRRVDLDGVISSTFGHQTA